MNMPSAEQQNLLTGGFKLCGEVTTLNSISNFLRT